MQVTAQLPAANAVSRPATVTNAISAIGASNIAGIVDGSLVAVDNVCLTSTSSISAATDSLGNLLGALLG
jgi:hypothetical protein